MSTSIYKGKTGPLGAPKVAIVSDCTIEAVCQGFEREVNLGMYDNHPVIAFGVFFVHMGTFYVISSGSHDAAKKQALYPGALADPGLAISSVMSQFLDMTGEQRALFAQKDIKV